ncbi:MAG: hypothetical protein IKS25_04695 [Oscillospiraceae bacterium]|jgi:hypothetical protein|nr:hypothetical protein [Oscillospiraceae bacterium]
MDGEMLKYMIYLWMLAVAGVGGLTFLADLIWTACFKVTDGTAAKFKRAEFVKCFLRFFLLVVILAAAYAAAQYLGSMTT